jgi:hypothetical protein
VLIIFNRPETTKQVVAAIVKAKPTKLLVVADGPRPGHPTDAAQCAATRAIIEQVDWPCEVLRHYSDVNLGCGRRPATGISWAFEQVEEAIILEDDCVPHATFFPFCAELLERFRDDERIMQICGSNRVSANPTPWSYFFSRYNPCWGWATWRRAWRHFDYDITMWASLRHTPWLSYVVGDTRAAKFWQPIFARAAATTQKDYWDYQWTFACWTQSGLSIWPAANLITNIGLGPDATHTKSRRNPSAYRPTFPMCFPLQHPTYVMPESYTDALFLNTLERPAPSPYKRFYKSARRLVPHSWRAVLKHLRGHTAPIAP